MPVTSATNNDTYSTGTPATSANSSPQSTTSSGSSEAMQELSLNSFFLPPKYSPLSFKRRSKKKTPSPELTESTLTAFNRSKSGSDLPEKTLSPLHRSNSALSTLVNLTRSKSTANLFSEPLPESNIELSHHHSQSFTLPSVDSHGHETSHQSSKNSFENALEHRDSQSSTASSSNSQEHDHPHHDIEAAEIEELPAVADHIADRLIHGYECRLIKTVPQNMDPEEGHRISFITAEGLYQQENGIFIRRLSKDQLCDLRMGYLLEKAAECEEAEGLCINNQLTLPLLLQLEDLLREHNGHTLTGYSLPQQFLARLIHLNFTPTFTPPPPEARSRHIFNFLEYPAIQDIDSSLIAMIQTYVVFAYGMDLAFDFKQTSPGVEYDFYINNLPWIFTGMCIVTLLNYTLLRASDRYASHSMMLKRIEKLQFIEESIIGTMESWTTYGTFMFSPQVIEILFIPLLLASGLASLLQKKNDTINVHHHTLLKTVLHGIWFALRVGAFCRLGVTVGIDDIFFAKNKNLDDDVTLNQALEYRDIAQYLSTSLALIAYLLKYSKLSSFYRTIGLYTSNAMNIISIVLLNKTLLFGMIEALIIMAHGNTITPNEKGLYSFYFISQFLVLTYVFPITLIRTQNISELSLSQETTTQNNFKISFPCINSLTEDDELKQNSIVQSPV